MASKIEKSGVDLLTLERNIQNQVIRTLNRIQGVIAFEVFNGAKYSVKLRSFLKNDPTLRPPGIPDIFGGAFGKAFAIEMKRPGILGRRKGVTKDEQKEMHARLRSLGYEVEICYTLQEAVDFVMSFKR